MSRMNTQERTIFLNNLDRMLSLLNCTYKNINIKYAYFPIPRTTIYRWMTGNTYPNKDWSWGEEFLSFYNQIFDPEIEDSKEFFQKKRLLITKYPPSVIGKTISLSVLSPIKSAFLIQCRLLLQKAKYRILSITSSDRFKRTLTELLLSG